MKTLRTLAILAAAGLAAGCSFIPAYERPAAPVPAAFPGAAASDPSAATPAWREYFGDARLRELIELALANNRDLRVAGLNIEKARAQYGIQRAELVPSFTATGAETVQRRQPVEQGREGKASETRYYSVSAGFAAYELDFFGRLRSLTDQALEQYLGTEEARRSAQVSLIAEVSGAWLRLGADRERLALAGSTFASRQKSHELTQRSYELGAASALDLGQSRTLLEAARAEVARYTALVAQGRNVLALIVGAPVPESLLPESLTDSVTSVAELPPGLPSDVLVRRPDILQAERQLRAANANIGAARAAFFPRVTLTANAGSAAGTLDGLFESGSGTWSFIPQIVVPIFHAGQLSANLEAAKVQREIALAQYEKAIQTGFREVADALAERATLADQLAARRQLVETSRANFRLSEARYKVGIDSYLNLLDAQRSQYGAELDLIGVRLSDAANRVALYKVLGGGWQE